MPFKGSHFGCKHQPLPPNDYLQVLFHMYEDLATSARTQIPAGDHTYFTSKVCYLCRAAHARAILPSPCPKTGPVTTAIVAKHNNTVLRIIWFTSSCLA